MRYPKSHLLCILTYTFVFSREHQECRSHEQQLPLCFNVNVTNAPSSPSEEKSKQKQKSQVTPSHHSNAITIHHTLHPSPLCLPSRRLNRQPIFTPICPSSASALDFPAHPSLLALSHHFHSPPKHPLNRLTNHHPILVFPVLHHIAIELHNLHQLAVLQFLLLGRFAKFACGEEEDFLLEGGWVEGWG
jgi:hypothetical protein